MIEITCSMCRAKIKARDKDAGKTGKCPKCKESIKLPVLPATISQDMVDPDKMLTSSNVPSQGTTSRAWVWIVAITGCFMIGLMSFALIAVHQQKKATLNSQVLSKNGSLATVAAAHPKNQIQPPSPQVVRRIVTPAPMESKPPKKVFSIKGMRLNDRVTGEFAKAFFQPGDEVRPIVYVRETIQTPYTTKSMEIGYEFINQRLASVDLTFPSDIFSNLVDVYSEKLGPADNNLTKDIETKGGVKYVNEIAIWETEAGTFILQQYGTDIDHGLGTIHTKEAIERFDQEENQRKKELMRGLQ